MDKKLSERVRDLEFISEHYSLGGGQPRLEYRWDNLADEIASLERRLEKIAQGNPYIGAVKYLNERIAETTDGAKLYRELWLDAVNISEAAKEVAAIERRLKISYTESYSRLHKENDQLRTQLAEKEAEIKQLKKDGISYLLEESKRSPTPAELSGLASDLLAAIKQDKS